MTSNLGTPQLHEAMLAQQAALDAGDMDLDQAALDSEAVEEIVEPVIQSRLRPELLGAHKYIQLTQCKEQSRKRRIETVSDVRSYVGRTNRAVGRDRIFSSACAGRYSDDCSDGGE
jgi:hypothetical protein|eukprot:COSAG02_NODE_58_length_43613_cov_235.901572_26_plen_116_part_00